MTPSLPEMIIGVVIILIFIHALNVVSAIPGAAFDYFKRRGREEAAGAIVVATLAVMLLWWVPVVLFM